MIVEVEEATRCGLADRQPHGEACAAAMKGETSVCKKRVSYVWKEFQ